MDPDLVLIGRVVKAHGIRGEVIVHPLSDIPDRFAVGVQVLVGDATRTITASRWHQGRLLLGLTGVADRSGAERLRGSEVLAEPVDVEALDTFLASELVDLPVRHVDGRELGRVRALIELPAAAGYDLLEVAGPTGTWYLPAAEELTEVVEDADGALALVVDPPEGLLDGPDAG